MMRNEQGIVVGQAQNGFIVEIRTHQIGAFIDLQGRESVSTKIKTYVAKDIDEVQSIISTAYSPDEIDLIIDEKEDYES